MYCYAWSIEEYHDDAAVNKAMPLTAAKLSNGDILPNVRVQFSRLLGQLSGANSRSAPVWHCSQTNCFCMWQVEEDVGGAVNSQHQSVAAKLGSGDILPTFWVQAVDCWGNRTGPSQDLPFNVVLTCDALQASPVTVAFDDVGIAKIKGKPQNVYSRRPSMCFAVRQLITSHPCTHLCADVHAQCMIHPLINV